MPQITGKTRGGKTWTPKFIESIDVERCIGCGACARICTKKSQTHREL